MNDLLTPYLTIGSIYGIIIYMSLEIDIQEQVGPFRLRISPQPLVEGEPTEEPKLSAVLTIQEDIPPKTKANIFRLLNAIDQQELTFDDGAKLLIIYFMWDNTATVEKRMGKVFGDNIQSQLGFKLDHISIKGLRDEYLDNETLSNGYSQVLYALSRNQ